MPGWADGPMKRAGAHGAVLFWRFSMGEAGGEPRAAALTIGAAGRDRQFFPLSSESISLASIAVTVQNLKYLTNGP